MLHHALHLSFLQLLNYLLDVTAHFRFQVKNCGNELVDVLKDDLLPIYDGSLGQAVVSSHEKRMTKNY
jgi:hypothetical protein